MILVTGATGLVGCRLIFDLVQKGRKVRALMRPKKDLSFVKQVFHFYDSENGTSLFNAIEWVEGDILDTESLAEAIQGVEYVYHSAGLVSYRQKDFDALMAVNQEGTANVVNVSLNSGVRKLCHISSVAALGRTKNGSPITEETEWNQEESVSNYSLSKFSAEQEVWRGIAEGLPAVIVNPSIILGPAKDDQSSGMLMAMLRKGVPYFPGGTTGYVDVRDVSKICIELMESDIQSERFLLNGENIAYKESLGIAAEVFDKPKPKFKVSRGLLELAWMGSALGGLFGLKPKITRETARSASRTSFYNSDKAQEKLNTTFSGFAESLEYYRGFYV